MSISEILRRMFSAFHHNRSKLIIVLELDNRPGLAQSIPFNELEEMIPRLYAAISQSLDTFSPNIVILDIAKVLVTIDLTRGASSRDLLGRLTECARAAESIFSAYKEISSGLMISLSYGPIISSDSPARGAAFGPAVGEALRALAIPQIRGGMIVAVGLGPDIASMIGASRVEPIYGGAEVDRLLP
jgi:hypothetical protein